MLEAARASLGGIELDPCTEPDNPTRAERFYALPTDGLAEPWDAATIYCNPPYGRVMRPWAFRAIEAGQAGARVALLVPADFDTAVGQALVAGADAVALLRGRLMYETRRSDRNDVAPFASAVFLWNVATLEPWHDVGRVVRAIPDPRALL